MHLICDIGPVRDKIRSTNHILGANFLRVLFSPTDIEHKLLIPDLLGIGRAILLEYVDLALVSGFFQEVCQVLVRILLAVEDLPLLIRIKVVNETVGCLLLRSGVLQRLRGVIATLGCVSDLETSQLVRTELSNPRSFH